jgi:hypothetical protein
MKRLLVAIIFIAALCGVLYFAFTQKPAPVAMPDNVQETTGTTPAEQETKTIKEETSSYTIDVDYKLFGIPSVDAHVVAEVQKAIVSFKDSVANTYDPPL